jgi:hypothetical protein
MISGIGYFRFFFSNIHFEGLLSGICVGLAFPVQAVWGSVYEQTNLEHGSGGGGRGKALGSMSTSSRLGYMYSNYRSLWTTDLNQELFEEVTITQNLNKFKNRTHICSSFFNLNSHNIKRWTRLQGKHLLKASADYG